MKQRKAYKTYTPEFKQEAVRLMETSDRPVGREATLGLTAEISQVSGVAGLGGFTNLFLFLVE